MMFAPAAMFAMFFFLSLFIQQIVGYTPLHAGFAFLPFSFGIVIGAALSSNLVSRIDPRFIAGIGTLMASGACSGSPGSPSTTPPRPFCQAVLNGSTAGTDVSYWTSILPFVILMSVGMGMTFVPLTLTAVHHVRSEDSGIGSGVLNTMQQVGGALGLATLATVSLHFVNYRTAELAPAMAEAFEKAGADPTQQVPDTALTLGELVGFQSTFTDGATAAFLVGLGTDARRLAHRLDLPRRQARGARHRRPRDRPPHELSSVVRPAGHARASSRARMKAGRSSGLRLVMSVPSTTTSSSTHSPPALRMSSAREW